MDPYEQRGQAVDVPASFIRFIFIHSFVYVDIVCLFAVVVGFLFSKTDIVERSFFSEIGAMLEPFPCFLMFSS